MNGSYQLLKFLSRVCCRLSDRSAVKMGHILGEFFWMLIPNRRKKLALQNIFRGNITKDVKTAEEISKAAAVRFGTIGMSVFLPHANRGPLIRPLFAALVSAELWKCRVER